MPAPVTLPCNLLASQHLMPLQGTSKRELNLAQNVSDRGSVGPGHVVLSSCLHRLRPCRSDGGDRSGVQAGLYGTKPPFIKKKGPHPCSATECALLAHADVEGLKSGTAYGAQPGHNCSPN